MLASDSKKGKHGSRKQGKKWQYLFHFDRSVKYVVFLTFAASLGRSNHRQGVTVRFAPFWRLVTRWDSLLMAFVI